MLITLEQPNAEKIVHVPTCGRNILFVVNAHFVCAEIYVDTRFENA